MSRLNRDIVEHWLWWSVLALALRREVDVGLAIKTAHLATLKLWNE